MGYFHTVINVTTPLYVTNWYVRTYVRNAQGVPTYVRGMGYFHSACNLVINVTTPLSRDKLVRTCAMRKAFTPGGVDSSFRLSYLRRKLVFTFSGLNNCHVRTLKVQRDNFCSLLCVPLSVLCLSRMCLLRVCV